MENKISKIGISSTADEALDRMVIKANDGFNGGRVSKNDLTSWIICEFEKRFDANLEHIRKDHFDQVAYLESVVREMKQAKRDGSVLPEIGTLLAPITEAKLNPVQKKPRAIQAENKINPEQSKLIAS